jgi:hypothetical protein
LEIGCKKLGENKQLIKGFIFREVLWTDKCKPLGREVPAIKGKITVFFERSVCVKNRWVLIEARKLFLAKR